MANHTPLPWAWVDGNVIQAGCPDEEPVIEAESVCAKCGHFQDVEVLAYPADRDLIVACVNACGAVNPENPAAAAEALAGLIAACRGLVTAAENPTELGSLRDLTAALDAAEAAIADATKEG